MCGICGILNEVSHENFNRVHDGIEQIEHRGLSSQGVIETDSSILGHCRLAIVGTNTGAQPLQDNENQVYLTINGEIYNYRELMNAVNYTERLRSDCDALIELWNRLQLVSRDEYVYERMYTIDKMYGDHPLITVNEQEIERMLNLIQGDFAFCLVDDKRKFHLLARDAMGVVPMYYAYTENSKEIGFASEMKCLSRYKYIEPFPPGAYYDGEWFQGKPHLKMWYKPKWRNVIMESYPVEHASTALRLLLTKATQRRLMSDSCVKVGVLLSGGLDSSIIAALTTQLVGQPIDTFSVGLEGSVDMMKARVVAQHLNSRHHECVFTIEEGIRALPELIKHLETYDITTIRASTPMYLLAKYIRSKGFTVVLSGEGSDEIFGGYLYFHNAPSDEEFRKESIRRVNELHLFDCLRANKSCMAFEVEPRVPFLDKDVLEFGMRIHPDLCLRNGVEKWILRKAFEGMLPEEIVWRQKEQFSDGVGYGWIDALRDRANVVVSDEMYANAERVYPYNPPQTKEAYWYRMIFEQIFSSPKFATTVQKWIPTWNTNTDPSGRSIAIHQNAKIVT